MTDSNNNIFKTPDQKRVLESLSNEIGFEVPVDLVALPSQGLIYSPEHPLCNTEEIEVKCLTAKEEDLLSSRALIKSGTVLSRLIQSCLINKSVDPETLLTGDRNAILAAIRITGYGPEYEVRISCPSCLEEFDNVFTLNNLKIDRLSAVPIQENVNIFSYILPLSGLEVHFKLLTGKDEREMIRESDAKKKKLGVQTENLITSRLFHSIVSISGENDRLKILRIVSNLRAGDSRALRKYIDKIEPGIDMTQDLNCPLCGEVSEVDIPLGMNFFWPDL